MPFGPTVTAIGAVGLAADHAHERTQSRQRRTHEKDEALGHTKNIEVGHRI
jgi:hypothetical protein